MVLTETDLEGSGHGERIHMIDLLHFQHESYFSHCEAKHYFQPFHLHFIDRCVYLIKSELEKQRLPERIKKIVRLVAILTNADSATSQG